MQGGTNADHMLLYSGTQENGLSILCRKEADPMSVYEVLLLVNMIINLVRLFYEIYHDKH